MAYASFIALILFNVMSACVLEYTYESNNYAKRQVNYLVMRANWVLLLIVLLVVVALEEFVFRQLFWNAEALLQKELATRITNIGYTLISPDSDPVFQIMPHLSSVLFVLYHAPQLYIAFKTSSLFWVFIYMAQIYSFGHLLYAEKNFWRCVGFHMANNVCVMILAQMAYYLVERRLRFSATVSAATEAAAEAEEETKTS